MSRDAGVLTKLSLNCSIRRHTCHSRPGRRRSCCSQRKVIGAGRTLENEDDALSGKLSADSLLSKYIKRRAMIVFLLVGRSLVY